MVREHGQVREGRVQAALPPASVGWQRTRDDWVLDGGTSPAMAKDRVAPAVPVRQE
jgi:hypothetical protein